jgi:hypothetical protein
MEAIMRTRGDIKLYLKGKVRERGIEEGAITWDFKNKRICKKEGEEKMRDEGLI